MIQSNRRLTYDEVNVLFNTNEASEKNHSEIGRNALEYEKNYIRFLSVDVWNVERLTLIHKKQKFLWTKKGAPTEIVLRERGVAERLIESFMLAANETVARHHEQLKVPFIYRIHENPDSEKLQIFLEFITAFGITIKGKNDSITPKKLQRP